MPQPCEQADKIAAQGEILQEIRREQKEQRTEQKEHRRELQSSIEKLTEILITSTRQAEEISRNSSDINRLYAKERELEDRVGDIEDRNARCDGAGIFERFPQVWDWFQQEKGWRRFIPTMMAVLAALAAIIQFMEQHN